MPSYAAVHQWDKLEGVGDARPTALQIIKDYHQENALKGQNIVITGVSSGFGAQAAIALAATDATVYCAGRSIEKSKAALQSIANSPNVRFLEVDVASEKSIRTFAEKLLAETNGKLHMLVNNAGGMFTKQTKSVDGYEYNLAVNYMGPFLLFSLLEKGLLAAATPQTPSRVVNVASVGHKGSDVVLDDMNLEGEGVWSPPTAYGQAKTALIYMSSEIERRFGAQNIHSWSLQPGASLESNFVANTGMSEAELERVKSIWPKEMFKSTEQGAATIVWAAVSDDVLEKNVLGKYLEDCAVAKPAEETAAPTFLGHAGHIYNQDKAEKTWAATEKLLSL